MSDRPSKDDSELGITFGESRPPRNEEAPKTSPAPTIEEVARDAESFKSAGVFDVGEAEKAKHELGTIVTDRKKRRASISHNIGLAFNQWLRRMRKTTKPVIETLKPKEVPKVEKVEKRVDVLESAATHASMAPKDDHKVVIEKIKTFKRDVEKVRGTPFLVKEEPKGKQPTWPHTIDTSKPPEPKPQPKPTPKPVQRPVGQPDLRPTMVAPIVEKHIKGDVADFYKEMRQKPAPIPKRSTTAGQIAFMHIPGTVEHTDRSYPKPTPAHIAPVIQEDKPDVPAAPPLPIPPVPRETIGYIARESARKPETPPVPPPAPPQVIEDAVEGAPSSMPQPHVVKRSYVTPKEAPSFNMLWTAAGGGVAVLAILFLISLGGDNEGSTTETVVTPIQTPSVIDVDDTFTVPLRERGTLFAELTQMISEAPEGITHIHPIVEGEGSRPATSQEFFATIESSLPPSTVRTLDPTFTIGSVTTHRNEPFLVLRSSRFDELFAGLLAWEPRMRADLSPLFDVSFVEKDAFTDAVKENRPVRVLYDALGNEVMLYTIEGQDTVIITSSEAALSLLLQAL